MHRSILSPILVSLSFLLMSHSLSLEAWANQPNIVVSQALYFLTPGGESIAVVPGKYHVEQAGTTHMRLKTVEGTGVIDLQAKTLTHEQYELFSAMAMTRPGEGDIIFVELLLPGGVRLQSIGSTSAPSLATQAVAPPSPPEPIIAPPPEPEAIPEVQPVPSVPESPPVQPETSPVQPLWAYLPPSKNISGERVDGIQGNSQPDMPQLFVLAPDHTGLTVREQPVLYWFLTQPTDHPIDMKMIEEDNRRVVLDARLLPPIGAGSHQLNLEDYDVRLLKDVSYRWTGTMSMPSNSSMVTATGFVRRVDLPPSLSRLTEFDLRSPEAPKLYAKAGLWYDALGILSDMIHAHPQDASLIKQRNALLSQVGLEKVAAVFPTP